MRSSCLAYRLNESLDWFELRTGGSIAPLFQIPSSPIRTAISPQHLEGFLEQVGFHALEVVLDDLVESCLLCVGEVFGILCETVLGVLEHLLVALASHPSGFTSADLIKSFVEIGHDVEAIEDVAGLRNLLGDHFQVRLPHVRTDVADLSGAFLSQHPKKAQQRMHCPLRGYMQQAAAVTLDLVDEGNVVVAFAPLPLIDTDRLDPFKTAMLQAILDHRLHRGKDRVPAGAERFSGLLPTQSTRPSGEKKFVDPAQRSLPFGPGNPLDLHSATPAIHPARTITQKALVAPHGHELVQAGLGSGVVTGALFPAARANRPGSSPDPHLGHDAVLILDSIETARSRKQNP